METHISPDPTETRRDISYLRVLRGHLKTLFMANRNDPEKAVPIARAIIYCTLGMSQIRRGEDLEARVQTLERLAEAQIND